MMQHNNAPKRYLLHIPNAVLDEEVEALHGTAL